VKLHQHETFQHLQQVLADRLINTFALICAVGLPVSLYRWIDLGFQPIFIHHIVLSVIIFIAAICKKRIKSVHLIILVVVILTTMTFSGAATFGLQSGTVSFGIFTIFIVAFVWGLIPAIIYLGVWCAFIIGLGYMFTQNIIQYQIDPAIYAYMPSAWAIVIIGTLITALFILIMGSAFYRAFDAMLLEVYEQKQQLAQLANKDPLTELLNLRAGLEVFSTSIARAKRKQTLVAMLFIDINKFKKINDVYGHVIGDQTLVEIATNLKAQLREYDYAIRVGGDEFIVLLNDVSSSDDVIEISERLLQKLEIKSDTTPFITPKLSVGIALYPHDGNTFNELKQQADEAMYQAKNNKFEKICINNKKL
jgi:diguanylate cyclase (GGDEF)-like protein